MPEVTMLHDTFALRRAFHIAGYIAFLLLIVSKPALAQQNVLPCGLNYNTYQTIQSDELPAIDSAWLHRQRAEFIEENVAYNFKTHFAPRTSGEWKAILPGIDSWFLKLRSAGAHGMGLVLSGVHLQPGEAVYIYNQQESRGPFTVQNVPASGVLPVSFLQGDEIVIEYDVPTDKNYGTFVIETVSHAFRNIFQSLQQTPSARSGVDCYMCIDNDIIELQRRSVVKLIIQYDSISKFCSGVLINNTAHDNKPYVLTAQHCISNQFDADRTIAVFGFEDIDCVGKTHFDDFLLTGAYHRASLFENDFALLEFYTKPPLEFNPYYAGWDISDRSLDGVTCVHHPQGGPKKISLSNNAVVSSTFNDVSTRAPDAYWNVFRWDVGVTEGGSSGAPLFNNNNHVIGSLSGGSSDCGAPYNDYFEKISASWEASENPAQQLKHWLDPVGSGVKKIDGNDPFKDIHVTCDIVSNIKPEEQMTLLYYTLGYGFYSGINSAGIDTYAEKFSMTDSALLTRISLNVGSITTSSVGGVLINVNANAGGLPGASLAEVFVPYSSLVLNARNDIEIFPYVQLTGDFFVSYTISYSPGDAFALLQADWRTSAGDNSAFVKLPSGWTPITTISPNNAGSAFSIDAVLCHKQTVATPTDNDELVFFPNPTDGVLIAKLPQTITGEVQLTVLDVQGKQQTVVYNVYDNDVVITTADLSSGIYIVKLSTSKGTYRTKVVKH